VGAIALPRSDEFIRAFSVFDGHEVKEVSNVLESEVPEDLIHGQQTGDMGDAIASEQIFSLLRENHPNLQSDIRVIWNKSEDSYFVQIRHPHQRLWWKTHQDWGWDLHSAVRSALSVYSNLSLKPLTAAPQGRERPIFSLLMENHSRLRADIRVTVAWVGQQDTYKLQIRKPQETWSNYQVWEGDLHSAVKTALSAYESLFQVKL
jgi:hypothetical protein